MTDIINTPNVVDVVDTPETINKSTDATNKPKKNYSLRPCRYGLECFHFKRIKSGLKNRLDIEHCKIFVHPESAQLINGPIPIKQDKPILNETIETSSHEIENNKLNENSIGSTKNSNQPSNVKSYSAILKKTINTSNGGIVSISSAINTKHLIKTEEHIKSDNDNKTIDTVNASNDGIINTIDAIHLIKTDGHIKSDKAIDTVNSSNDGIVSIANAINATHLIKMDGRIKCNNDKIIETVKKENQDDKFGLCCWHLICDNTTNNICLEQIKHNCEEDCEGTNKSPNQICPHGEDCCEFKRVFDSNGIFYDSSLESSINHCTNFVHRTLKNKEYFLTIMNELNNYTNDDKIFEIMSKPDFDIDYTIKRKSNSSLSNGICELNEFDLLEQTRYNVGMFNLLGKICMKCNFETFKFALDLKRSKPNWKIDSYTLFQAIAKRDLKYIELLGKEQFNVFPNLSIPLGIGETNRIEYIRVVELLKTSNYKQTPIAQKFKEWNLYM